MILPPFYADSVVLTGDAWRLAVMCAVMEGYVPMGDWHGDVHHHMERTGIKITFLSWTMKCGQEIRNRCVDVTHLYDLEMLHQLKNRLLYLFFHSVISVYTMNMNLLNDVGQRLGWHPLQKVLLRASVGLGSWWFRLARLRRSISYANDFLVVSSEVIYYRCFDRKWKEVLIPCQLLVSFPVIKPVPTMLACKVLYI